MAISPVVGISIIWSDWNLLCGRPEGRRRKRGGSEDLNGVCLHITDR